MSSSSVTALYCTNFVFAECALALLPVRSIPEAEDGEEKSHDTRDNRKRQYGLLPSHRADHIAGKGAEECASEVGERQHYSEDGARLLLEPVVDEDRAHQIDDERKTESDDEAGEEPADE